MAQALVLDTAKFRDVLNLIRMARVIEKHVTFSTSQEIRVCLDTSERCLQSVMEKSLSPFISYFL